MTALARMNAGLIVWAAAFCLIYALHGLGCEGAFGSPRAVLLAAWIGSIAANTAIWVWIRRSEAETLTDRIATRVAIVGTVATFFTGLPILIVPACV